MLTGPKYRQWFCQTSTVGSLLFAAADTTLPHGSSEHGMKKRISGARKVLLVGLVAALALLAQQAVLNGIAPKREILFSDLEYVTDRDNHRQKLLERSLFDDALEGHWPTSMLEVANTSKPNKPPPKARKTWATDEPDPATRHEDKEGEGSGSKDETSHKPKKESSGFGHQWAVDEDRPYGGSGRRPDGPLNARAPWLSRERDWEHGSQFGHIWAYELDPHGHRRRPRDRTWKRRWRGGHDGQERAWFGDAGVKDGDENPAIYLPSGRQPRRLRPRIKDLAGVNPPATSECPALICDLKRLEKLGVHTGERFTQWSDRLGSTSGLEDSYSVGPAPQREWRSPAGMYDDVMNGDDP